MVRDPRGWAMRRGPHAAALVLALFTASCSNGAGTPSAPSQVAVPEPAGVATVTAAAGATVATLQAVDVTPSVLVGGETARGAVTLTEAAAAGGVTVNLAAANGNLSLPASVTIGGGQRSASFDVTSREVDQDQWVDVTATADGVSHRATVGLKRPVGPATLTLTPSDVAAGSSAVALLTLSHLLNSDMVISLTSSHSDATVPASLTMRKGEQTAQFTVATREVRTAAEAVITATGGVRSASARLRIGRSGTAACAGFTVTSIAPNTGARGGNTNIAITGTGFAAGASINAGTLITVNTTTVASSTTIEAQFAIAANAATGARNVTVIQNGSPCVLVNGFTVT